MDESVHESVDDPVVARLRAAGCVFAEQEAVLLRAAASGAGLAGLVERRAAGEPLEYVLGWAEFCGLRVGLEPGVFVPRHRSALLVDRAVAHLGGAARPVVVDLCCGSGALGWAVVARCGRGELHAADLDPVAVRCARRNLAAVAGTVHHGDLDDALPAHLLGRVGVLVANVPYVPTAAIALLPPEARDHEARLALDGGPDGLAVLRRLAGRAGRWLTAGGAVLVEVAPAQVAAATAAFAGHGFVVDTARADDDADDDTVVLVSCRER